MSHRISSSMVARLLAVLMVLFGAAASPAAVKRHHHHTAALHHGAQDAIDSFRSHATSDPDRIRTDTKPDGKGKSKASIGEETRPSDEANTKGQKVSNHTFHGDDRGSKSPAPEKNPIDTSITILGPPPHGAKTHRWNGFEIAHRLRKSSGAPKIWTPKRTIFTRDKAYIRDRIIRNAIGQPLIRRIDAKGRLVKKGDAPTVNGIPMSAHSAATGGRNDVALVPHHKPIVPPAWSSGGPHDPPTSATLYRAEINGRDMIRIGAGTAAIAGGANLNTGVLSGSSFHPKVR